jgi:ribosomal protein L37E
MKKEKTFLLRLDEETFSQYKKICKENGYNMTQRIRNFIENELKNEKINN